MTKEELANLWQFPWPVMDVLIGGKSSIDLTELNIQSNAEASSFLRSYGYDPETPADRRLIHSVQVEAVTFIEQQLLLPREWQRGIRPPDELLNCDDPCKLLLWASIKGSEDRWIRHWACAVLRVMHTIAHLEGVHRTIDMQAARAQIFSRFEQHLQRESDGDIWFGGKNGRVELAQVEWKEAKSRNSIILKLLHKRDNVAETIYDYVGIRLITKNLCDVMLVVKLLHKYNIIVYPNAYPSRARNNLIDIERFHEQVEVLRQELLSGSLTAADFSRKLANLNIEALPVAQTSGNPHSLSSYRAIQLTSRQLIKIPHQKLEWLTKLAQAQAPGQAEPKLTTVLALMKDLLKNWPSGKEGRFDAAFFPFEVQILDATSHQHAQSGEANHDRYKSSQIRAARKRVLSQVLEFSKDGPT